MPLGHSDELGDYVEYRERRLRSLMPIAFWLGVAIVFAIEAGTAGASVTCFSKGSYHCTNASADANRAGAVVAALLCVFGAFVLGLRALVRRPLVRVGDLGVEDRTNLLARTFILWQDAGGIGTTYRRWRFWQQVLVDMRQPDANGRPWFQLVRVSGLSAPPSKIEDEMFGRLKAYDRHHPRIESAEPAEPPAPAHVGTTPSHPRTRRKGPAPAVSPIVTEYRYLEHVRVQTGTEETYKGIATPALYGLLAALLPEDFVILESPDTRDPGDFIQACQADGEWHVEYHDAATGRQYQADCDDIDTAFDVLVQWAADSGDWRTRLPWDLMTAAKPTGPA
jgi:hypothetical protein